VKTIITNNFKKVAYPTFDDNTMPGFLPQRNRPNSQPKVLFGPKKETKKDIKKRWKKKKQEGVKDKKVYQNGDIIQVVDNGEDYNMPVMPF